jgi:outer membrane protein, heavy metal efflux system
MLHLDRTTIETQKGPFMGSRTISVLLPLLLILAAGLQPATVFAEQAPVVRWQDIEALLGAHPSLLALQDDVAAAKAGIRLSRQYPNPEVGGSYGRGAALEGDESDIVWGVEVGIPILSPGVYVNETRAAKANFQAEKNQAELTRRGVVHEARFMFYRAAVAQELAVSFARSRNQVKRTANVARLRVDHGEAPPMELTRLEIELEKAEVGLAAAQTNLAGTLRALDLWLGGKLPAGYRVQAEWANLPALPPIDALVAEAQRNHPALLAAGHRVQAAAAELGAERNRLFPELNLGAFYDKELDAEAYGGLLSLEFPLWNWNRGGTKTAKARLSSANHQKTLAQRNLLQAIYEAHAQATLAIETARRYRDAILPKAREVADSGERRYQIGEIAVMDLLDARRNLVEIETEMQDAFLEGWRSYLNLLSMIGETDA